MTNSVGQSVFSSRVVDLSEWRLNVGAFTDKESRAQEQWREPVEERLEKLIRLDQGWDGYLGIPTKFANAVFALRMLESICTPTTPTPQIVPGSGGDVQVEWHTHAGDIELHVRAPNQVEAWRCRPDGREEGFELTNDFSPIVEWINELEGASIAAKTTAVR